LDNKVSDITDAQCNHEVLHYIFGHVYCLHLRFTTLLMQISLTTEFKHFSYHITVS